MPAEEKEGVGEEEIEEEFCLKEASRNTGRTSADGLKPNESERPVT